MQTSQNFSNYVLPCYLWLWHLYSVTIVHLFILSFTSFLKTWPLYLTLVLSLSTCYYSDPVKTVLLADPDWQRFSRSTSNNLASSYNWRHPISFQSSAFSCLGPILLDSVHYSCWGTVLVMMMMMMLITTLYDTLTEWPYLLSPCSSMIWLGGVMIRALDSQSTSIPSIPP